MDHVLTIGYLFDSTGAGDLGRLADTLRRALEDEEGERRLRCAACRRPLTRLRERIDVQGAHAHTRTNPHGFVFRFGCFRHAEGCAQVGEATAEWSWFKGFEWRIVLCAGCRMHVGWFFQAPDGEGFHGLVLDRLVQ